MPVIGVDEHVLRTWLAARPQAWRDGVQVVAMDGFTGFKTAAAEELPDAVAVMDPFHVVRLAGEALDRCRQRVQQQTVGHRGRKNDPLYTARRTLHTGTGLLTAGQNERLADLFAGDKHVEVEATWTIYQRMITAYRQPDKKKGREVMATLIDALGHGVPAELTEVITLGRTLNKRAGDVLAYFERPGTSNGPTEAINGRLEHLRGTALGFPNLTNYIARSLLETGGFRLSYTLDYEEPVKGPKCLFDVRQRAAAVLIRGLVEGAIGPCKIGLVKCWYPGRSLAEIELRSTLLVPLAQGRNLEGAIRDCCAEHEADSA